jgi:hypothetical protein
MPGLSPWPVVGCPTGRGGRVVLLLWLEVPHPIFVHPLNTWNLPFGLVQAVLAACLALVASGTAMIIAGAVTGKSCFNAFQVECVFLLQQVIGMHYPKLSEHGCPTSLALCFLSWYLAVLHSILHNLCRLASLSACPTRSVSKRQMTSADSAHMSASLRQGACS